MILNPLWKRAARSAFLSLAAVTLLPTYDIQAGPVRLHPANGRYFEFRGAPAVLVGSSEHYGALINLDFDHVAYLETTRTSGLNLVRVFSGTYREAQGEFNIQHNTLAPPTARAIAPWKRTTTGGAADGGYKFDLNQWDPAYFSRLRDLASQAGQRGIVVEFTFFSAFYNDGLWLLSPLNSANHVNGAGGGGRLACFNAAGDLIPYQKALVRKCVAELAGYDNIIFEICNEPYMNNISQAWQDVIANELVAAGTAHPIAQNVFNYEGRIINPHPAVSLFNFHYAYPAAAEQNLALNRVLGDDETGFAGNADFPYRREAWEFMLAGGGLFNHLDYSFTATNEQGTATQSAPGGGGPAIRRQLAVLRSFLGSLPLVELAPLSNFVTKGLPAGGAARAIGVPGKAYGVYLRGGILANLTLNLPAGTYGAEWIDTKSGAASPVPAFSHDGGERTLVSPAYSEDIALRIRAEELDPPPSGSQLVQNGGFDLGGHGWSAIGNVVLQAVAVFNGEDQAPGGVLTQSLPTVPGETYRLSFDAGVISYNTHQQHLGVEVNGADTLLSETITLTGAGNGTTLWLSQVFTFVADSPISTITFHDQSTTTLSIDLLLDNVQVHGSAALGTPTISGVPGQIVIRIGMAEAGLYVLERSVDLVNWQPVAETQLIQAGPLEFLDSGGTVVATADTAGLQAAAFEPPGTPPRMFYRIGRLTSKRHPANG